jgi:hypothetical protein
MANPEKDLSASLARFLGVRPPKRIPNPCVEGAFVEALELWPAGNPSEYSLAAIQELMAGARRGSSENWVLLALANAVIAGVPGANELAVSWLTELKTVRGWMGNEIGTRDGGYWYFFLVAVAALVRHGSPAVQALAWEWLDLLRFLAWTGAPMTGQRSVLPGLDKWTICDDTMEYVAGRGPLPAKQPPTFDRLMVLAVAGELAALRGRPLSNPAWKTATAVVIDVGDTEARVVLAATTDSNTIACLASKRKLGSESNRPTQWAPAPEWGVVDAKTGAVERIREQSDGARCVISADGVAHYTSRIFKAVDMARPAGTVRTYHLASGSIQPDGAGAAAAQVPPPAAGPGGRPVAPQAPAAVTAAGKHTGCLVSSLIELGVLAAAIWCLVGWLGGP